MQCSKHHFPTVLFILTASVALKLSIVTAVVDWFDLHELKLLNENATANILVSFKFPNTSAIREEVLSNNEQHLSFTNRAEAMYLALKNHAQSTQAEILSMLRASPNFNETMRVFSFWITNQIGIQMADRTVAEQLLSLPDVEVREEPILSIHLPRTQYPLNNNKQRLSIQNYSNYQWGVKAIAAMELWERGAKGFGVTVAGIDTGVHGTHEALKENFRPEHGWYDPIFGTSVPTDTHGHGTHTMGTMVGRKNGIGVAPEARWIACRACGRDGKCPYFYVLFCSQFIVCPTDENNEDPRCDLRADVVSNSWGYPKDIDIYDDIIDTWVGAGIVPVLAAGNAGPSCATIGAPATHPNAISVGAFDVSNMVSNFSSRGPSRRYEGFKPDVAAPGVDITSAATNSEVHYKTWSGTSMAAPHVAGVVALLKSKYPGLTVEQARDIVRQGVKGMVPVGENCQVDDSTYPNNQVGYGRIYAPACLEALKKITSPAWNVNAKGESLGFILLAILFAYITVSV